MFWVYTIASILWGLVWGFATRAVARNRGYGDEDVKWFWLGFFFSFIAIIVAATKPEYQPPVVHVKTEKERQQEILDEGGRKCVCGRVNYHYVSSCACGKNRREGEVKKQIREEPQKIEEKSDTAKIKEYKELLDSGIITQEEFDAKKKQLLGL